MEQFWEQWGKLSIAVKTAIVLFCWAGAGAAYYFLYYTDQEQRYTGLRNQFRQLRQKRMEQQVIAQNLQRWQDEVKRLEEEKAKAKTLLPTAKEIPILLQQIDNLATKSGLEIMRVRPLEERPQQFYAEIPLEMEVRGAFYELMVFFDKISNLDRIVNVNSITFETPQLRNQKLALFARFQVVTYRYVDPQAAPPKKI